ncbi:MAG: MBL fold metallo-hydrolase [Candidatus Dojkabacteria bacterium]|nr:MBL fold metallo-hydrolase [Candidatus Dojkabacteria bacterium]MDQ7021771.1 MBL fold metallo-hydrolase [Candidatus Dojkabacteria bacterium]
MKIQNLLLAMLVTINFIIFEGIRYDLNQNDLLEIYFLDVGQGDSILIKTPNGSFGLIDTGRESNILTALNEINLKIDKFEFVIITHPDADHYEGILELTEYYDIRKLFLNKTKKDGDLYLEVIRKLHLKDIKTFLLYSSTDFTLDSVDFDILWPISLEETYIFDNINDSSTAILITFGNLSMYSAGDLSSQYELESISQLEIQDIDILKVGHHGSKASTSFEFLEKISPEICVVQVGEGNQYGHPNNEILINIQKIGATMLRTDSLGNIKISSNGEFIFLRNGAKIEV